MARESIGGSAFDVGMAERPSVGRANGQGGFFEGESLGSVLQGVRGVTQELAAGFAKDPRERQERRRLLEVRQQQQSEVREERIKRLRQGLTDILQQQNEAKKSGGNLGPTHRSLYRQLAVQLMTLTGDGLEFRTAMERMRAAIEAPTPAKVGIGQAEEAAEAAGLELTKRQRFEAGAGGVKAEQVPMPTFVVSGDTPIGEAAGIPPGEKARVRFNTDPRTGEPIPEVLGRFGGIQKVEQGPPGSFEKLEVESRTRLTAIKNIARRGREAIALVQKHGADILGASGFLSRLSAGFGPQAESIARKFGIPINIEAYTFPTSVESAPNARIIKSAVLDLAIMKAQAIGLGTGKGLSDRDVQLQIDSISGSFGDPAQFIETLRFAVRGVALDFQQERRDVFKEPGFDIIKELGEESALFFQETPSKAAPSKAAQKRIEDMTLEELQKLSLSNMTEDELRRAQKRFRDLGGK